MNIQLSENLIRKGEKRKFQTEVGFDSVRWSGSSIMLTDCSPVELTLENTGENTYSANASFTCTAHMPCGRCLKDVPVHLEISAQRDLDLTQTEEERKDNLDEQPYLRGYELDVDEFIRNELFLNIPMRVLCKEDCKGLCPKCGANLNEGDCGCEDGPLDPRMAAIQEIFKNANMQG